MVFALLLELCSHVQEHSESVKFGQWSSSQDFCYWNFPLVELAGKTMGIIGYGRIGSQVGAIANAMGMKVAAYDNFDFAEPSFSAFTRLSSTEELFKVSDVISLNCPLTDENKGMINSIAISLMKKETIIINASRGPLINEKDLADALNNNRIAGAGLDVLSVEPPLAENPLLEAKNCIITPHIAWATKEARSRLMQIAVDNLKSFVDGDTTNKVR